MNEKVKLDYMSSVSKIKDINTINNKKLKDCRTCQNMSCGVESYEKPVEDCFGYIYHEKEEQGIVKKLILNKK